MTVPPDQPNPQPGQPYPGQGQPYPPAGQPYPPAGQPYPPAGQYAGEGQPFAAGQPYPAPGQPTPPAVPKKNPLVIRLIGVLVAVAIGAGVWFFFNSNSVSSAEVGDCFAASGSQTNPDGKVADCADDSANYIVTQTADSSAISCDEYEISFTLTVSRGSDSSVCLRPNVEAGECWNEPMGDAIPSVIPCGEAGDYTLKVTGVVLNSTDEASCPNDTDYPAVFEKRSVVYCFTDPAGASAAG